MKEFSETHNLIAADVRSVLQCLQAGLSPAAAIASAGPEARNLILKFSRWRGSGWKPGKEIEPARSKARPVRRAG